MSGPARRRGGHRGVNVNATKKGTNPGVPTTIVMNIQPLKRERSFATRVSGTRCVSFKRLQKKGPMVLHSYGVVLMRRRKGRTVNRGQKRPEAREAPQTVGA